MDSMSKNVREAALEVLEQVEKNQSYSNLLLNHTIEKYEIKGPDVGLLTELTYGSIQRKMTLDYYLKPFIRKKVENWVRLLLHLSLYQMLYLDRVPERAAIHEAVEIDKKRGHKGIAGLVNGILRSIQREGVPCLDEISNEEERISIETSHPLWLVNRWSKQFGREKTRSMCETNVQAPLQSARTNLTKATRDEVLNMLQDEGLDVRTSEMIPEGIVSLKGNLAKSKAYKEGYITVQDESSMAVAYALDLQKEQMILDACAAPGGKTTHIAERLNNTGVVEALDLHKHKVALIKQNADRLQLTNVTTHTLDSRKANELFKEECFDRILVDAPCSGLGVVRRKPDIKYAKNEKDLNSLQRIQLEILNRVAPLLKKGGILVYSTCTVDQIENDGTVQQFLKEHHDFEPAHLNTPEALQAFKQEDYKLQIFPQDFGGDGFFISSFRKKG
ncbi:16S rRNA (cytosine(967)-C(5))-methyltransferase RsmB [Bacillus coahuilensis]